MGIRQYKPTTPGRRGGSVSDFADITDRKKKPEKSLLEPSPRRAAATTRASSRTRFRGGGHKRMYRIIDFKRNKDDVWADGGVDRIRSRTARPASPCLQYEDGEKAYILAPEGLKAGDKRHQRRGGRAARRQLHAAAEDPAGHDASTTWRCSRAAAGRLCRSAGTARDPDRPRRQLGADHAAVGRSAPRQLRVPGHHRHRSATPIT